MELIDSLGSLNNGRQLVSSISGSSLGYHQQLQLSNIFIPFSLSLVFLVASYLIMQLVSQERSLKIL